MQRVMVDRADFHYIARLVPVSQPVDHYSLQISSRWLQAKNPDEERIKLEVLLDLEGVNALRSLINEVLP